MSCALLVDHPITELFTVIRFECFLQMQALSSSSSWSAPILKFSMRCREREKKRVIDNVDGEQDVTGEWIIAGCLDRLAPWSSALWSCGTSPSRTGGDDDPGGLLSRVSAVSFRRSTRACSPRSLTHHHLSVRAQLARVMQQPWTVGNGNEPLNLV